MVSFDARVFTSREGEEGDNLYVIQSGVFEAVKGIGDDEKLLFKYEEAGAFGELALMYNCRRAATVRVSHLLVDSAPCVDCSKGLAQCPCCGSDGPYRMTAALRHPERYANR